jgi:hypothetical protein
MSVHNDITPISDFCTIVVQSVILIKVGIYQSCFKFMWPVKTGDKHKLELIHVIGNDRTYKFA